MRVFTTPECDVLHARLDHLSGQVQPWRVKRNQPRAHAHPAGHVWQAVATIGAMSLSLAAGLELTGGLARLNDLATRLVATGGMAEFPKRLPDWSVWLIAVLAAFGMAAALLLTAGGGRRILLWLTAVLLMAAWAPVLGLAAHYPAVAAPWVAVFWSGACAVFYASRHQMPCDEITRQNP
ncbi:MAG: hypothetical protein ACO3JG_15005 [Luteolibacter sp.]